MKNRMGFVIAATKTETGLEVHAEIDPNDYKPGIKVSKKGIEEINLIKHKFHGDDCNYTTKPSI